MGQEEEAAGGADGQQGSAAMDVDVDADGSGAAATSSAALPWAGADSGSRPVPLLARSAKRVSLREGIRVATVDNFQVGDRLGLLHYLRVSISRPRMGVLLLVLRYARAAPP